MSVLGMDANGVVRTAFEFKDIFDKSGISREPYCCPFCETDYIDRNISKDGKKSPHFALPRGKNHSSGCNGEAAPSPEKVRVLEEDDERKRKVVGDVEFPEELVDARRRRATFKLLPNGEVPSSLEVGRRRKEVDVSRLLASRYTTSLLRTFVMANRKLRKLADAVGQTLGEFGSEEYKKAFGAELKARSLQLYGERLTYGSAFPTFRIAPSLVIDAILSADAPRLHVESLELLRKAAAERRAVKWHAYGQAALAPNSGFTLRTATLDHVYID